MFPVPAPFVEKIILFPLNDFGTFFKIQGSNCRHRFNTYDNLILIKEKIKKNVLSFVVFRKDVTEEARIDVAFSYVKDIKKTQFVYHDILRFFWLQGKNSVYLLDVLYTNKERTKRSIA